MSSVVLPFRQRHPVIEVRRFPRAPSIVLIDGEPLPVSVAAARLGMSSRCLSKRIERGTDLARPLKKLTRE